MTQAAVSMAIGLINETFALRGIPVLLQVVPSSSPANVKLYYDAVDCDGASLTQAAVTCLPKIAGPLNGLIVPIHLNPGYFNGASQANRQITALHELLHAVGLGDEKGAECTGSIMYWNTQGRTGGFDIDEAALEAAECVYGNMYFPVCYSILRASLWADLFTDSSVRLKQHFCEGCLAGCGVAAGQERAEGPTATDYMYELAVSDSGGPFTTFATLGETDWVNGEYVHTFGESHRRALFSMRVLDGTTLIDEAVTMEPIDVVRLSRVETEVAGGRDLKVTPNPVRGSGEVEFRVLRAGTAELTLVDVAGRRVMCLTHGDFPPGTSRLQWAVPPELSAGVYWLVLQSEGSRVVRPVVVMR